MEQSDCTTERSLRGIHVVGRSASAFVHPPRNLLLCTTLQAQFLDLARGDVVESPLLWARLGSTVDTNGKYPLDKGDS